MSFLVFLIGTLVPKVYADSAFDEYCGILHPGDCSGSSAFAVQFALQVGNFFAMLIAGAAVLAIMYAGIKLMVAGGNDQGKEDAKKIIITALIGLVLAIGAEMLISFVSDFVQTIPGA